MSFSQSINNAQNNLSGMSENLRKLTDALYVAQLDACHAINNPKAFITNKLLKTLGSSEKKEETIKINNFFNKKTPEAFIKRIRYIIPEDVQEDSSVSELLNSIENLFNENSMGFEDCIKDDSFLNSLNDLLDFYRKKDDSEILFSQLGENKISNVDKIEGTDLDKITKSVEYEIRRTLNRKEVVIDSDKIGELLLDFIIKKEMGGFSLFAIAPGLLDGLFAEEVSGGNVFTLALAGLLISTFQGFHSYDKTKERLESIILSDSGGILLGLSVVTALMSLFHDEMHISEFSIPTSFTEISAILYSIVMFSAFWKTSVGSRTVRNDSFLTTDTHNSIRAAMHILDGQRYHDLKDQIVQLYSKIGFKGSKEELEKIFDQIEYYLYPNFDDGKIMTDAYEEIGKNLNGDFSDGSKNSKKKQKIKGGTSLLGNK